MSLHMEYGTPEDLPRLVEQHRARLLTNPDDAGARYMLGSCLHGLGRFDEGRSEWETLRALGDPFWTDVIERSLKVVRPTA